MALKTYVIKFKDKEISVKAKKEDAGSFVSSIRMVLSVPSMVRELTGIIGCTEGINREQSYTMQTLFGSSGTPLDDPDGYAADLENFYNDLPPFFDAENMGLWAQRAADLVKKHTPVNDKRITQEEAEESARERKAMDEGRDAKRQEKAMADLETTAELIAKYNHLEPIKTSGRSRWAGGAANIRAELTRAFHGVDFRVKSESYSMGSSITVKWTDGPTSKQVKEITDKYQTAHFDGMQDLETHVGGVFNEIFGGAKYVFETREESDALVLSIANGSEFNLNINAVSEIPKDLEFHVRDMVKNTAAIPTATAPTTYEPEDTPTTCGGVTVRLNDSLNGVEVLFSHKPDQSVIDMLKAHSFRWNHKTRLWYAKQSESRIAFAYGLAGKSESTTVDNDFLTEEQDRAGMEFCPSDHSQVA